jgi:hypothetical protein
VRRAAESEAPLLGAGVRALAVAEEAEELRGPGRGDLLARGRVHPGGASHRVHPLDATRGGERTRAREAEERDRESPDGEAAGGWVTHPEI